MDAGNLILALTEQRRSTLHLRHACRIWIKRPRPAFDTAIVTRIGPDRAFYPAEDYHQDFLTLHPAYPYIVINDMPKLDSLKRLLPDVYRRAPVLVAMATTAG